jgi:hypothetical protein
MNEYIDWADLVSSEAEQQAGETDLLDDPPQKPGLEDLLEFDQVPEELRQLLQQRAQLEKKVRHLTTGADDDDPDAERNNIRYAVPVHTKGTRIIERREKRQEEERLIRQKKWLEKRIESKRYETKRLEQLQDQLNQRRIKTLYETKRLEQLQSQRDWRRIKTLIDLQKIEREKEHKRLQLSETRLQQLLEQRNVDATEKRLRQSRLQSQINLLWDRRRGEQRDQLAKDCLAQKAIDNLREAQQLERRDNERRKVALRKLKEKRNEDY